MKTKKSNRKQFDSIKHHFVTDTTSTFTKLKNAVNNHTLLKDFWVKRINAAAIDYFILFLVTGIIWPTAHFAEFVLTMGLLSLLYFVITEAFLGYTIGKKMFSLKVVTLKGTKPSLKDSFTRNMSKFNSVFLILDTIVGRITSSTHQRFLDRIANTTVDDLSTIYKLSLK